MEAAGTFGDVATALGLRPALELELRPLPRRRLAGQFVGEVPAVDGADTVDQAVAGLRLEAMERVG